MIATRAAAGAAAGRRGRPASASCSMMKRLICRIASGWSRWVRTQVFSQRWSQTRPRIAGSGLSRRVIRTASREVAVAHGAHVAGHLLVDRALVEAGRRDAVEEVQAARRSSSGPSGTTSFR